MAKVYLWRFKPQIVAVTGNVGKTSTKEAIAAVLGTFRKVRSGKGNLNNEFGVPLTILGDFADDYYDAGNSAGFWVKVLAMSFVRFFTSMNYPEVLVLEYGADKPGDIGRLVRNFKPHIGVVTAVGDIPVHIEFFNDAESVAKEKAKLVKKLGAKDLAVLNHDDDRVLDMKDGLLSEVKTFGFQEGANLRVTDYSYNIQNNKPLGVEFKINGQEISIDGSLGKSQAYAAAAAAAVGQFFGLTTAQIKEGLANYRGPKGRLRILAGIKNSIIIDDTYNASPASTRLALETLRDLPAKRRIAILGDMLELGEYTEKAHQAIGTFAADFVDLMVCVGTRAKFIASEYRRASTAASRPNVLSVYTFDTSNDAKLKVQELVQEGDLVLVKGSQGARMEKIVEEIIAEPQRKKELLVRQGTKWLLK